MYPISTIAMIVEPNIVIAFIAALVSLIVGIINSLLSFKSFSEGKSFREGKIKITIKDGSTRTINIHNVTGEEAEEVTRTVIQQLGANRANEEPPKN